MNDNYMSITEYVECKSKLIGKIATYDILIAAMEKAILEGAISGHLNQWEMDDGQMKVRSMYRSMGQLTDGMTGLIKIRQMYINQLNGRVTVLRGGNL